MARIRHIPGLDGLRGAAVLGILLFHAGHLRGGWLGVDLFFVLSGYLITSLLLAELAEEGRVSVARFWARRARRLLPALLAMLAAVAAYAAWLAEPAEIERIRRDAIATLLYVANWSSILQGHDYWDLYGLRSPLDHTWSLAIEEQFYLVWPLAVIFALRVLRLSPRQLSWAALGLAASSALWMSVLYDESSGTARVYFGTDARASAVLLGSALAGFVPPDRRTALPPWLVRAGAVAATALLALAWLLAEGDASWIYRGGLFVLQCAGAVLLVALVVDPDGLLSRAFSTRLLRRAGEISYGLYLWHWPLYVTLTPERTHLDGLPLTALRLVSSVVLSLVSFSALEMPVRRSAWRPRTVAAAAATAMTLVAALVIVTTRLPEAPRFTRLPANAPALMVVGDSVAFYLVDPLREAAAERGLRVIGMTMPICAVVHASRHRGNNGMEFDLDRCADLEEKWRARIANEPIEIVLLAEGWPGLDWKKIDGEWTHPCAPLFDASHRRDLTRAVEILAAGGARVAIVGAPPIGLADAPEGAFEPSLDARARRLLARQRMACLNRVRREVAEATGAQFLDLESLICPDGGPCREEEDGERLRPDGVHFKGEAARRISRWLLDRLQTTDARTDRPPRPRRAGAVTRPRQ